MKDSGVEWIGEIPREWRTLPLGNCFLERIEKVSDKEWEPLSVTKKGIFKQLENVAKSDAHDSRKKVCKGDFVINSRSDRKQSCGLSDFDGSVSLINIVLKNIFYKAEYTKYLLKNDGFAEEFYRWGSGIVADLWSTKYSKMKKIILPVPSLEEQEKIANYLDKKVSDIDLIIEKTKATIEDYKKYKQSIITEAVTKGLNPNVEIKNSGIEWIGEIPKHFNIRKIKSISEIYGRIGFRGYTQEDLVGEKQGAITLSPSNFNNLKMNYSKCSYVSWEKYNESPEIQIKNGDILYVKTGSSYGKLCLVDGLPMEATINPQIVVLKNHKINTNFLVYYLSSSITEYQTELAVVGGTIPTIAQEKIKNYIVLTPSLEEQNQIAEYLDKKTSEIDTLITKKEALIAELEEYKKSLIYECVTGKKEIK